MAPCPTSGLIVQGGADEIVNPQSVSTLAKRLNVQRNVQVDFALIEEGDHMYNNHLVDLYKIAGNYVIGAMQKKGAAEKAPRPSQENRDAGRSGTVAAGRREHGRRG